jgi:hypothetical protein
VKIFFPTLVVNCREPRVVDENSDNLEVRFCSREKMWKIQKYLTTINIFLLEIAQREKQSKFSQ